MPSVEASSMFDEFYEAPGTVPSEQGLQRDQWGRPLICIPLGKGGTDTATRVPYTRVSTLAGMLSDKYGIHKWEKRLLARGIAARPDLVDLLNAVDPITGDSQYDAVSNAQIDDLVEKALWFAGRDIKADYGTAVHKLTEPGVLRPGLRKEMADDVAAYDDAMAGSTEILTETFVVNDALQAAGTFDCSRRFPGIGHILCDKKTGEYHPLQVAVQLATYAGGWIYDPKTDERTPLPDDLSQDVAFTLHVPKGEAVCDVYAVDLGLGRELAQLAAEVRDARTLERKANLEKLSRRIDPRAEAQDYWLGVIGQAADQATLTAIMGKAPRTGPIIAAGNARWAEVGS